MKALYDAQLIGNSVIIIIPLPTQTSVVTAKCSKGRFKYEVAEDALIWRITKFAGAKEHRICADVTMVSTTKLRSTWNRYVCKKVMPSDFFPHTYGVIHRHVSPRLADKKYTMFHVYTCLVFKLP